MFFDPDLIPADRAPDDVAVDDGVRRRTWAELRERSLRIAHWLRDDQGLEPGGHVAMLVENRSEFVELMLGAVLAGLWVTPVNWHLVADEVAYIVRDSGARILFAGEHVETARAAGAPRVVELGAELDALLGGVSSAPVSPDDPSGGFMVYTSGTTGHPKGVKRTRPKTLGPVFERWSRAAHAIGLDGSGPHLVTGPMYHAAPGLLSLYDLMNGAPLVIMPRWNERAALAALQERRIVHTHLVPTMFVRLLRLPEEERAAFHAPDLRLVLHGAAPISEAVKRRMIDWWGPVLVEYWGASEGGVNTLVGSEDWLAHPGTVGRALPDFEVFAVDAEGRRLPPGEVGPLRCRHAHLARVFEYHGDSEKSARSHPEPGVFSIGDIGCVDEDGWVYLADRESHTIISGGVNIYPAEIEAVLGEHPAVADVAVFGVPDDEWGESVKAAVELTPGHEASAELESAILDFARQRLAKFKVPRSIDFGALPREETGKLRVRVLREAYWKDQARRI